MVRVACAFPEALRCTPRLCNVVGPCIPLETLWRSTYWCVYISKYCVVDICHVRGLKILLPPSSPRNTTCFPLKPPPASFDDYRMLLHSASLLDQTHKLASGYEPLAFASVSQALKSVPNNLKNG